MTSSATYRGKPTKEVLQQRLQAIKDELLSHIGGYAFLFLKEKRSIMPHFVLIAYSQGHFFGKYACYDDTGKFRCYLTHNISPEALLSKEQKIVYIDENLLA